MKRSQHKLRRSSALIAVLLLCICTLIPILTVSAAADTTEYTVVTFYADKVLSVNDPEYFTITVSDTWYFTMDGEEKIFPSGYELRLFDLYGLHTIGVFNESNYCQGIEIMLTSGGSQLENYYMGNMITSFQIRLPSSDLSEIHKRVFMQLGAEVTTSRSDYDKGYDAGHDVGYDEGYAAGEEAGYSKGFSAGQTEAMNSNSTLKDLIFGIFSAPGELINGILDFDLFGINLASLVKTLLTLTVVALIVVFLFKLMRR